MLINSNSIRKLGYLLQYLGRNVPMNSEFNTEYSGILWLVCWGKQENVNRELQILSYAENMLVFLFMKSLFICSSGAVFLGSVSQKCMSCCTCDWCKCIINQWRGTNCPYKKPETLLHSCLVWGVSVTFFCGGRRK